MHIRSTSSMPPPKLASLEPNMMPPPPPRSMPPPPPPKFTSPKPHTENGETKPAHKKPSPTEPVPDTLAGLLDYGEEDDDDEGTVEELPQNGFVEKTGPKPFWAKHEPVFEVLKIIIKLSLHRSENRLHEVRRRIIEAFVPEGFPGSVTPDYLPFQIWDSLQGLSTYIRAMLSTQALLGAIGVGEKSATVIGATFQWFLRDFTGMLGGILFTFYQGSNLDSNAKMWRLVADFMNDLAGVASGATRAALTQHFSLENNAADISAKVKLCNSRFITPSVLSPRQVSVMEHILPVWASSWSSTKNYLLLEKGRVVCVITHKLSTPKEILRSYIHALIIASLVDKSKSVHMESRLWMEENYGVFISKLRSSGWATERLLSPAIVWRAYWSHSSLDEKEN
ncbi:hypothetical protein QJS10_CPB15g01429 [Acorus calamus]|uniref:Protein root UVB sensitive/RUS domain-containing protein n=1 Tax=Acorus calamus TaxID=4465 RepID=A0AAV9D8D9_ACOCL|nr:hypothetical protein QJS10_CPB15g01429 [Acorus calamus]